VLIRYVPITYSLEACDMLSVLISDLLQTALGKILFTADIWSDPHLQPFLCIMAHWIGQREDWTLQLHTVLVTFSHIPDNHTGSNIVKATFSALQHADIVDQVEYLYIVAHIILKPLPC